jgi:diacylglycerol kinase (ATP)
LRWGGGYEGESIPKLLEKIARSDIVMMDRWNISIEQAKCDDKDESLTVAPHKVLKVSELGRAQSRRGVKWS